MRTTSMALAAGLLLAALAGIGRADTNEEKLANKLAEPFVSNAAWGTGYDAALAKAKESRQLVFAYFTRSYAP